VKQKINRDQVIWLQDVLGRFRRALDVANVRASQLPDAAEIAAIHEIVEIFGLEWEDDAALRNVVYKFLPTLKDPGPNNQQSSSS